MRTETTLLDLVTAVSQSARSETEVIATVVHLVNFTNPMMMKGPMRELTPVGEQRVRMKLAAGEKAGKTRLLVSGKSPSVKVAGGYAEVIVPSVLDHEVVVLEL